MKNLCAVIIVVFVSVLFLSCSTIDVNHRYDPRADFTALKTYEWLPSAATEQHEKRVMKYVMKEIDKQLNTKGLKKTSQNPDVLISVHSVDEETWSAARYTKYQQGSLVMDVINPATKEPIWIGTATHIFDQPNPTDEELAKLIDEAITKLLKDFPPAKKM